MYQGGSSRVCATLLGDTFRLNIRNTTLTPLDLGWNALGPEMGEAGAGREMGEAGAGRKLCGSRPVRPFLKTCKTLTSLGLKGSRPVRPYLKTVKTLTSLGLWGNVAFGR